MKFLARKLEIPTLLSVGLQIVDELREIHKQLVHIAEDVAHIAESKTPFTNREPSPKEPPSRH